MTKPRMHRSRTARSIPRLTEETRRVFAAISDPKNAHLFTVEAALKALAHVKL